MKTHSGPLTVQITHTYGRGFPFPLTAVQTDSTALANGIQRARRFFYIEDQYFVGSSKMGAAIRHALSSSENLVGIVVIAAEDSVGDLPDLSYRRRKFMAPIVTDFPHRFLIFERLGTGLTSPPDPGARSTTRPEAYVHSKLLIVDDEAAFIGSVNSNQRSWFHDSEINATIVDSRGPGDTDPLTRGWVRNLRCELWSKHLSVSTEKLGDPAKDVGLWRSLSPIAAFVRPYDALVPAFSSPFIRYGTRVGLGPPPRVDFAFPESALEAWWNGMLDPS